MIFPDSQQKHPLPRKSRISVERLIIEGFGLDLIFMGGARIVGA